MATTKLGLPLIPDSTKVAGFPGAVRQLTTAIDGVLDGDLTPELIKTAGEAVDKAIDEANLVAGDDPRLPGFGRSEGRLGVLRDSDGYETWLGARSSDGGPTDHAMRHLEKRTGLALRDVAGFLLALRDSEGYLTDLSIRASDGQFADFVVDRLRTRILAGGAAGAGRQYADTVYTPGSDIFPVAADSTRAAGFGSSTMEGIDPFLGQMFAKHGVSYYAGGKGGEHAQHIAARMGAVPALVTVDGGQVPASGPVAVTTSNMVLARALRPYTGTLAGIPGELAFREGSPITYTFTRTAAGPARPIPADTPFIPDAGAYRDAVQIINIGKNNIGGANADAVVIKLTDACFDWLAPLAKRCLVVGHFINTGTPADAVQRDQITAINAAAKARYGRLYIDLSAYLTGKQVWTDTGITPTAEDLAEQALGNKPPSLSRDAAHMNNAAGAAAVTALFEPRLKELRWYA